ncbi:MAG: DUF2244 domain-containing protein [Sneathiella sp.]
MMIAKQGEKTGSERPAFSIILHPHRSLDPQAFLILMMSIGGVSFVAGMVFLLMGAWPVFGFFGLDVLLIYLAFRFNFREGRRCEIVEIVGNEIRVRHITPDGYEKRQGFEAYWTRFEMRKDCLFLLCRTDRMEIGKFLIDEEKADVRNELETALHLYRNNMLQS